jgi:hypothetical protein
MKHDTYKKLLTEIRTFSIESLAHQYAGDIQKEMRDLHEAEDAFAGYGTRELLYEAALNPAWK